MHCLFEHISSDGPHVLCGGYVGLRFSSTLQVIITKTFIQLGLEIMSFEYQIIHFEFDFTRGYLAYKADPYWEKKLELNLK